MPALTIVIPAYNEASRVGGTLDATLGWLDARRLDAQVIVVDDGSRDGTVAEVLRRARVDPRVQVIELRPNRGKGAAVREGVLRADGARVLFMDADLATPLDAYDALAAALDAGADVAIGSRALPDSDLVVRQHPAREAMGRGFNFIVRGVTGLPFRDTQCGFKLFTRDAAQTLFRAARVERFAFDVELLMLAQGRFRVVEVPVQWRHVEQSTVSPIRDGARTAFDLLRLRVDVATRALRGRR